MDLRPAHSCSRVAYEHGQRPFSVGFIEAKDVQASVTAPNLDVAIVRSVPLIEHFENLDLMLPEMKFQGHGHSAMVSMLFDMNTHFGSRVIRNNTPRLGQPALSSNQSRIP
jgi:hypothetical protein